MAFHSRKDTNTQIKEIMNYHHYLKTDTDPSLRMFQTPEGFYLNVTRIEQTEEEKKCSESMETFYNNYRSILEEKQ